MWIEVLTPEDSDEVMKRDPIKTARDATGGKVGGDKCGRQRWADAHIKGGCRLGEIGRAHV